MTTVAGITGEVFEETDARPWEYLNPPVHWEALGADVIADRCLPDGTRQHLVRGHVAPGTVIDNAQVVGQADLEP